MQKSHTRQWHHPEGYKYLAPWTNAVLLRFLIRKFTEESLPRSEFRTKTQLNDSGRSVIANIEEGYKRSTTQEYLKFIGFSQGSLEEIKGDIKRVYQDSFLKSKPSSKLSDLGIDLKEFKGLLEDAKGNVPLEVLYPPLATLKAFDLTYEMFMELINKTDWLLRRTVLSLERRADQEMPMSPRDKWLKRKMEQRREEERKMDEEIKRNLETTKEQVEREKGAKGE